MIPFTAPNEHRFEYASKVRNELVAGASRLQVRQAPPRPRGGLLKQARQIDRKLLRSPNLCLRSLAESVERRGFPEVGGQGAFRSGSETMVSLHRLVRYS